MAELKQQPIFNNSKMVGKSLLVFASEMLVVLTSLSLLYSIGNCVLSPYKTPDPRINLAACAGVLVKKYFSEDQILSYFNVNLNDDSLLKDINSLDMLTVYIRKPTRNMTKLNKAYIIIASDVDQFTEYIESISKETRWEPSARFLILIDILRETEMKKIFNILLQHHIYNVVLVNGTETAELYTYNPFENYACGKYYNRIIEFGKCSNVASVDLYPNKLVTGLRNCFFYVSCPHWPPYSIEPAKSNDKPFVLGTEQYIFDIMSRAEHFTYNFTYNYDAETFSTVSRDMSVSGPLTMIQTNRTDVMLGGLILNQARAKMFFYVHGHLDQVDDIKILVKRASVAPAWKNIYTEFSPLVWLLILLVLLFYTFILIILSRVRDTGHVLLVLMDYFFLHGTRTMFHARNVVNILLICWIWFAYLMNSYYQSSLVSFIARPSLEYQIQDENSLNAYGLNACISNVMQKYMQGESNIASTFHNDTEEESCTKLISSIKTVGLSNDRFTITLYTVYLYYQQQFFDEYGISPHYSFSKPFNKVIYAMYLYKGFPMVNRLHKLALRIRETGLSDKSLKDQYFLRALKYRFHARPLKMRYAIPWHVFIVGISLSFLTFLIEIIV